MTSVMANAAALTNISYIANAVVTTEKPAKAMAG